MSSSLCPYVGTTVITAENQTFTNDSSRTVGTCLSFSCYTDFYLVGSKTACCKLDGGTPKWDPSAASCKLNETAELVLIASKLQMTETACYAVIGSLAGLVGLSLLLIFVAVLCCFTRRRDKKDRDGAVVHHVVYDYGPEQPVRYDARQQRVSQPPSYTSGNNWPSGSAEYPLYSNRYSQREVVDYEKTRNVEDAKPNLWLTYGDSLEGGSGHRSYRNRAYDYSEDDRDAAFRENFSRRW